MARKSDPDTPGRDGTVTGIDGPDIEDEDTAPVIVSMSGAFGDNPAEGDATAEAGWVLNDAEPLPATDAEALKPGFVLGDRFEIVALVHSGGMGHVYKAIDRRRLNYGSGQIHVGIKMLRRSAASPLDASFVLEREAANAQRLSHPNVVNIYDFDRHDEQFYLVMEWLEGESVMDLLRRTRGQPLAPEFAWQVIHGIAGGLQHAHANNVVHADINPSNVFITNTQQIKLLDFGVARYAGAPEPGDDSDQEFVWATRGYASPQVLSGQAPVFEDDIFSLGCVAYRLLSGARPFAGSSSAEARKAGAAVQPIPGLSEAQWQIVSRALSYERADRPNSASAFIDDRPAATDPGRADRASERQRISWQVAVPLALIAVLASTWWLTREDVPNETPLVPETATIDETPNEAAVPLPAPSELDELLGAAAQAMSEERYTTPEENNARVLYRDVLTIEPDNPVALGGLRTISDVFVQRANAALQSGNPEQVVSELANAAETDPGNPSIAIVNELLLAQGNAQLASARLAAAEGDMDLAATLLSDAERYPAVAVSAIDAVRQEIAASEDERLFLNRLAAANTHIAAGRLIAPAGNNAQETLIGLLDEYQADSRLLVSTERLAERLLSRSAFAATADRIPEARELLDAADTLGVLTAEVAAARVSLLRAEENRAAQLPVEQTGPGEELPAQATISAPEPGALPSANNGAGEPAAIPTAVSNDMEPVPGATPVSAAAATPVPAATATPDLAAAAIPDPAPAAARDAAPATDPDPVAVPPAPRLVPLSELDIEKFVPPEYPRRAMRRELTGSVELRFSVLTDGTTGAIEVVRSEPSKVFVPSARNAVRQWRFAPPDEEVRARVTLRFEQPVEQ